MGNLTLNGATSGQITLAPTAVAGTNTITVPAATGTMLTSSGNQTITGTMVMSSPYTMRNKIINGAMVIDQRYAGASFTQTTSTTYSIDRWASIGTVASKFTVQQNAASVTPPAGFKNYLGVTSASAYSVSASDTFAILQTIEGFNVADLAWGTASAQTVTVSFWVRSSLTGTFGGSLTNDVGSRSYPFSYTISSANTWEQKSVTITGDTTGTWQTNNSVGISLRFGLGSGATYSGTANAWAAANYVQPTSTTSVVGTNGATFYITGVQLEIGTTATPFEYRNYQQELAMCQRYYRTSFEIGTAPAQNTGIQQGAVAAQAPASAANVMGVYVQMNPSMRTQPTLTFYNPNAANSNWRNTSAGSDGPAPGTINNASTGWMVFANGSVTGANTYQIHYSASAEL